MANRIWNGGTGDWYSATQWTGGVAPTPGDTAQITAGTVDMIGTEAAVSGIFDNQVVTLGSTSSTAPATMTSSAARFGPHFTLETPITSNYADFISLGETGFAGTIDVVGGSLKIITETSTGQIGEQSNSDFVLNTNGSIAINYYATLTLSGRIDDNGQITINQYGTLDNTGIINVEQSQGGDFIDSGSLIGGGTIDIGLDGAVSIASGVSNQTFDFTGLGGALYLKSPTSFLSPIENFLDGDFIDLSTTSENTASYNAGTDILSVYTVSNGATSDVISLHVTGPTATSTLTTVSDGSGGTIIEFLNSPKPHLEYVAGGAEAVGANIVQATLTTPGGTPINGAGIKIGIISSSFNNLGGANTDAAGDYLPENNGTSAVTVLQDQASGGDDEGRAMAELIYQVAPGAQLYFYTGGGTQTSEATAVNALVAAGVNVIVDDETFGDEPFFQVTGPDDTAIQNAISAGVDYFTAATNLANNYYQANFTATPTTLPGVTGQVLAQTFTNGTQYETITLTSTTDIDMQWDAPFPTTTSGTSALALVMLLYNSSGQVAYISEQDTSALGSAYVSEPDDKINNVAPGTYTLAVAQTAGMPAVSSFKYILVNTGEDAEIDDPAAESGSGAEYGHQLVPGVNTVAASTFSDSPAFTGDDQTEWFSAAGPGELLYDSSGNAYTTPVADGKPDFTAPDGIEVAPDLSGLNPFYGTSAAAPNAAAVAALVLQANPTLTPAEVTSDLESTALNLDLPTSQQGAGLVQAVGAVDLALKQAACFAGGTRLATSRGDIAVEALREGDLMLTANGTCERVIWIGHRRIDGTRHPRPADIWPVRIRKNAFGADRPYRDLWLSPEHAVFAAGVLIPCKYLINGDSIVQEPRDEITYWHVELGCHDVILAEGLPCESYLDTGNRHSFANAGKVVQLSAEFSSHEVSEAFWEATACAPLRIHSDEVAGIDAWLRQQRPGRGVPPARRLPAEPISDLAQLLQHSWYLANCPDVANRGMDAATHYHGWGWAEGRLPCPEDDLVRGLGLIDPAALAFTMADVVLAGVDPVAHFCETGWREGRRPSLYFDTSRYRDEAGVPAGMNPLLHYVLIGERQGLRPSRHFDPAWYRQHYALAPTTSALAHYLAHRRSQRVGPLPDFAVADYVEAHRDTLRPDRDPYAHYLSIGRFVDSDRQLVERIAA